MEPSPLPSQRGAEEEKKEKRERRRARPSGGLGRGARRKRAGTDEAGRRGRHGLEARATGEEGETRAGSPWHVCQGWKG